MFEEGQFGGEALGCIGTIVSLLYRFYAVQKLWNWFVAEAIHGSEISYFQAIGIVLLFGLLKFSAGQIKDATHSKTILSYLEAAATATEELRVGRNRSVEKFLTKFEPLVELLIITLPLLGGFLVHTFFM